VEVAHVQPALPHHSAIRFSPSNQQAKMRATMTRGFRKSLRLTSTRQQFDPISMN